MKNIFRRLWKFICGIAIGLANMVAGLSGGTIAVILGVYDDMLDLFSNLATHLLSAVKRNWRLIAGIGVGIIVGTFTLSKLYEVVPLPVTGFFAGMVFFSLIPLFQGLKFNYKARTNALHIFELLFMLAFMIALPFFSTENRTINLDATGCILIFCLGIIGSLTMVLPGVSGALVLMALGYYTELMNIAKNFMEFQNMGYNFGLLVCFGLGTIFGVVLASKVIKKLVEKCSMAMNFIIYGLIAGSLISMCVVGLNEQNVVNHNLGYSQGVIIFINVITLVLMILGMVVGYFMELRMSKLKSEEALEEVNMNNKDYTINDFLELSEKYFDDYKKTLKELVKFPSVLDKYDENSDAPFGEANKEALHYMLNLGEKEGFKTLNSDNYAGHIQFGDAKETLGLLAHLDVVPVKGQKWDNDPFTVVEKDGKLIGRGVNDDKGPLLASYYAMKILKDLGFKPNKNIKLIMGCDEESGSRCLEHYFKYNPMPELGFSPDACFPCINGEKAHTHIDVVGKDNDSIVETFISGERYNIVPEEAHMTLSKDLSKEFDEFLKKHDYKGEFKDNTYYAYGVAAHAMTPEKGFNAAFVLFEFLNEYAPSNISKFMTKYVTFDPFGSKLGLDKEYPEMGKLTENVGVVKIENNNVLVGFDLRVPADEMEQAIRDNFTKALSEYEGLKFEMPEMTPVHYVPKDSFLVQALVKSYQEATGDYSHGAYCIGGGTYAKFMDKAVAFGPQFIGREDVDHQANEYIYESDYKKIIAIYAKSIYDLTK